MPTYGSSGSPGGRAICCAGSLAAFGVWMYQLDLDEVDRLLRIAREIAESLAGTEVPADHGVEPRELRRNRATLAELSRELLFLRHLCDKAGALVADQYHALRGYTEHLTPDPDREPSALER